MIYGTPKLAALTMSANGPVRTKRDAFGLPTRLEELVECARSAKEAGAALFSFTVRDDKGNCCIDAARCRDAMNLLRAEVGSGLLLQMELDTGSGLPPEAMADFLRDVSPDIIQVRFDQILPRTGDESDEAVARDLFDLAENLGIGVQIAMHQPGDIDWFYAFRQYGIIPESCRSLVFVLGEDGDEPDCDPQDLRRFLNALEKQRLMGRMVWSVAAFGPGETASLSAALALGGHVAAGFAYNVHGVNGEAFASQKDQISLLAKTAGRLGRPTAGAFEARALLFGPK
ncbi:Uncharacterized conserved protein, DUF849 family [Cohaesibacter sp. ES.047]|uniref:3-keto-5-aminohexanoate cleavage protein n=1 Tax=Cohaesibacter sp. ES.047 TaxID=1798205 RepID=UPI000BB9B68B|nr:3-keto-5-aminohexanoate cleavage protein [Cohaesibacter sp. ES.047]SNY91953.1 Uncharacterized conserved protein, DUF849 family [Cohaesibacter sp. ES.047]